MSAKIHVEPIASPSESAKFLFPEQNTKEDYTHPKFKSIMQKANFLNYLHFGFIFKTVKQAKALSKHGKNLEIDDLPALAWEERPDVIEKKFLFYLDQQKERNQKPNLGWAIFLAYKGFLGLATLLQTLFIFLKIFTCWILMQLLEHLGDPLESVGKAFQWAGILSVVLIISMYFDHHYFYVLTLAPTHIKAGVISMIYNKVTRISLYSLNQMSLGKIVNIIANDVNVFERTGNFLPSLITGPLALIGATAMLWIFYGPVCLVGIGIVILGFPLQQYLAQSATKPRDEKNKVTDARVKLTNDVIEGIRLLKMYTWELIFGENIKQIRKQEVSLLRKVLSIEAISRGFAYTTQPIACFSIFLVYSLTGGELTSAIVFPTTFLISTLKTNAITSFASALNFLAEAKLLFDRVLEIMQAPEISGKVNVEPLNPTNAVEFDGFSATWSKEYEDEPFTAITPNLTVSVNEKLNIMSTITEEAKTLQDITLNIKRGSLNALIGRVGSGKSSLMLALTGEMPHMTGKLRIDGRIAYVEQEPTIFSGTIRDNILFGRDYKPDFYHQVINACCLDRDLQLFANGDMSEVGEKGINISGGQKARLALARAVYSDADIYLLDDPLSAVDSKVASQLFDNAICGMLRNKTVILATHQVHFVKNLKDIMIIDNGRVLGKGSYDELKSKGIPIWKIFSATTTATPTPKNGLASRSMLFHSNTEDFNNSESDFKEEEEEEKVIKLDDEDKGKLVKAEDQESGKLTWKNYIMYFSKMGKKPILVIAFLVFLGNEIANVGFSRILGSWSDGDLDNEIAMIIMGLITIFIVFIYISKNIMFNLMMLRASNKMHSKMINNIIKAPTEFFDTNPVGRILNRFSNDVGVADRTITSFAMDVVEVLFSVISMIITIAVISPLTLIPSVIASILIVFALLYCYESIKMSRNHDLLSRSPLYSLFSTTLSGLLVIRSYHQEKIFEKKFQKTLHDNIKANITYRMCSRFFGFYVDYIYNISAICSLLIVSGLKNNNPGLFGLSLSFILSIAGVLQIGLRQAVQTNVLMASVKRVQEYCDIPQEAPVELPQDVELKKAKWPLKGEISFKNVFMKYRKNTDHIVKGLTLDVKSGEKIGCIGRTGAGKSSIIQILFRMIEIDREGKNPESSYLKIDGVDTQKLGLHLLRDNISIIPQTPFVFSGTVKSNLDPLHKHSDAELWKVLEDVNLKFFVDRIDKKLYADMTNAASLFSTGQKQLICLARAILKKSKILVLDEATANVDMETDRFIQKKIMEKFSDCTIFTIAHRLSTIADYDKILVLDKGQKVEFDIPYKLLVKDINDNRITNKQGHFASMVLNTGPKTSKQIFEKAKKAYMKNSGAKIQGQIVYKKETSLDPSPIHLNS